MTSHVDRRRFLQLAMGSAGVAALGGVGFTFNAAAAPKGGGGGGGGGGTATRNPLEIPGVVTPSSSTESPTVLTAASKTAEPIGAGRTSNVLAYNGQFPGPSFQVDSGAQVAVRLSNQLADPTTIHWHGLVVPQAADGQPHEAVASGADYAYTYTVQQRAGLNFYHPHPHGKTGSQVYFGLAGALLVRDAEERGLGLPSGAQEVPLILRDATFDSAGNLAYGGKASGFLGKVPMVNGTLDPFLDVLTGTYYRFRVVNAATARIFRLAMSDARRFTLIGNDGGLLPAPVEQDWVDISPGERLDLLVSTANLGDSGVMLRDLRAGWDLLQLQPAEAGATWTPPTTLSSVESLGQPVATRTFSFDGMTRINGQVFSEHGPPAFEVPAGQVEKWTFTTGGNAPHPVHVHGASFQVIARRGGRGRLFAWEGGWKDTVLLEDGEQVDVLIRFDSRIASGSNYLIHCHKLEHEDAGMMMAFAVV